MPKVNTAGSEPEYREIGELPHAILVGTHHKTGTVWLKNVFESIGNVFGKRVHNGLIEDAPDGTNIYLNDHSYFNAGLLNRSFRGIHMIRDPRDIVISACHYHQKSDEAWLDDPQERFNGKSYREMIRELDSVEEKLLFEMEFSSLFTTREMLSWDYLQPQFMELKYEELIVDEELNLFRKMFEHLGFPEACIPDLLDIAYRNSLFSGRCPGPGEITHIRSGKAQQWKTAYTPRMKRRFLELYGNALIDLGYENNHTWAD